jgi:hypothetical protein
MSPAANCIFPKNTGEGLLGIEAVACGDGDNRLICRTQVVGGAFQLFVANINT